MQEDASEPSILLGTCQINERTLLIEDCDTSFSQRLGYQTADELINIPIISVIAPESLNKVEILITGQQDTCFDINLQSLTTECIESFVISSKLSSESRQLKFMDFTQTFRDANNLKKENKRLNDAYSDLHDFMHLVVHDLKGPLRNINALCAFIKEDIEENNFGGVRNRLQKIEEISLSGTQLLVALLEYSKVGNSSKNIEMVDFNMLLDSIKSTLSSELEENNATITVETDLPQLSCDSLKIEEVFKNLISNALKYNDSKDKTIKIGVKKREGKDFFYVSDNGLGIPEKHHHEIFKPFKRFHTTDSSVTGTGFGLAAVQKIVHLHNGSIYLESKIGEGTTFYFSISEIYK